MAEDITGKEPISFHGAAANHVTFAYGQETILNGLSLTVPKGQIVGITGKSGSGKSTLLRLFMRFWDAGSGKITFGGVDIRKIPQAELMRQVSFVFQDTFLFKQSILDNIRMGNPTASEAQVIEAAKPAKRHRCMILLPACPRGMVPRWGNWAVRFPAASASALAWPVPFCTMLPLC